MSVRDRKIDSGMSGCGLRRSRRTKAVRRTPLATSATKKEVEYFTRHYAKGEAWYLAEHELPLLVKLIFTSERLSVQVHPDDGEDGPLGKTEMWHILDAEPGATIALPGGTISGTTRLAMDPVGAYLYVSSYGIGYISVIDIDPDSPTFDTVIGAINVSPTDDRSLTALPLGV